MALATETWSGRLLQELPPAAGALAEVQRRGRAALAALPLPRRQQEDWRFTDLGALTALAPRWDAGATPVPVDLPPVAPGVTRLWLDGRGDPLAGVELPPGLRPLAPLELSQALGHTLAAVGAEHHWPVAFNHASAGDCLALRVSGREPVQLELVSAACNEQAVLPLRVLLLVEEKAQLELTQVLLGSAASLTSLILELHLGRKAAVNHGLLAFGEAPASLLAHLAVEQEPQSRYQFTSASRGWALSRLEPRISQVSGAAHTQLAGLQLAEQHQVADTHAWVRFEGPDGSLEQLHKAIADDHGRSIFNGAVRVPRAAQRTNAAQLSRNLLLSNLARIDTKPELEIVADDVRCAHGATVSRLQLDELFYLQSRGIDAELAASLLKRGFCAEVLKGLPAAAAVWEPLARVLQPGSALSAPERRP
ncbi:Fe-S cluster assembly protein SufD [Cyanobium sp. ATX 6F1]|uniref:Fe-S cluster assembly protein SufD n=1 Tax=Cyanobium sp. ATX 6F1 TaxID=2823702 RepID=UPI0020CE8624|nr:Fe-S cluster assembly protein SufD [Cyanobium sp. ATX 6F1]MCP9917375.1 Fe-S cluster assembly protein SufD [Cyanobium sp. ATX 6F1]